MNNVYKMANAALGVISSHPADLLLSSHSVTEINPTTMFKLLFVAALIALSIAVPEPAAKANPEPEAKATPAAKPQFLATAYTAPVVAAPVAYTAAYSAPIAYPGYYSSVYSAGYTAYSPYTAAVV
nr:unnamed protein product [Callosobruchus chinensis]